MQVGVPKEIKNREARVALTPAGAKALSTRGHTIFVEKGAAAGSGFSDSDYRKAGAEMLDSPGEVWEAADMIVKVKEPIDPEFDYMREGQILFTYLHLAADERLTRKLLERQVVGIAYETVQERDGSLPLLAPMSEVAGRLSVQMGCSCLEAKNRGKGKLLSGVPGVLPTRVVIVGGGISGLSAAHLAVGMGADVTILDVNLGRLRYLADLFHGRAKTLASNEHNLEKAVSEADLVIGSVLIPGAKAPKLVDRELLRRMEPGSALVDIAIDQGGFASTSRATTHDDPVYVEEGVVHYCVANMPGAVPMTSTHALTNATLPYVIALADKGYSRAFAEDMALARGLNVHHGTLTNQPVADAFGMECQAMAA